MEEERRRDKEEEGYNREGGETRTERRERRRGKKGREKMRVMYGYKCVRFIVSVFTANEATLLSMVALACPVW